MNDKDAVRGISKVDAPCTNDCEGTQHEAEESEETRAEAGAAAKKRRIWVYSSHDVAIETPGEEGVTINYPSARHRTLWAESPRKGCSGQCADDGHHRCCALIFGWAGWIQIFTRLSVLYHNLSPTTYASPPPQCALETRQNSLNTRSCRREIESQPADGCHYSILKLTSSVPQARPRPGSLLGLGGEWIASERSSHDGEREISDLGKSSPLPPSDMPSETSYLTDFDGYSSSEVSDTAAVLQKSDTVWDSSPPSRRATNTDLFGPVQSVAYSSAAPPLMTDYQIAAPSMYGPGGQDTLFDPIYDFGATRNSMNIDFSFFQHPDSGSQFSVPPSPSASLPCLPPIPAFSPIPPTLEPVTRRFVVEVQLPTILPASRYSDFASSNSFVGPGHCRAMCQRADDPNMFGTRVVDSVPEFPLAVDDVAGKTGFRQSPRHAQAFSVASTDAPGGCPAPPATTPQPFTFSSTQDELTAHHQRLSSLLDSALATLTSINATRGPVSLPWASHVVRVTEALNYIIITQHQTATTTFTPPNAGVSTGRVGVGLRLGSPTPTLLVYTHQLLPSAHTATPINLAQYSLPFVRNAATRHSGRPAGCLSRLCCGRSWFARWPPTQNYAALRGVPS
ncbi:hypothetical protein FB451DRAFT_1173476 [Mycena latifolia]|nr:hypothetical protein FB451DRAFT_1173476 [Mycena latifolia]